MLLKLALQDILLHMIEFKLKYYYIIVFYYYYIIIYNKFILFFLFLIYHLINQSNSLIRNRLSMISQLLSYYFYDILQCQPIYHLLLNQIQYFLRLYNLQSILLN